MPERYRRSEDALADLIRENRRGTRDAQRATGTEKAQTAVLAQVAWDQSVFAKQLAEQLETDLGPLPGQVQDALDDASAALVAAGLARSDAATAVSDAQQAVSDASQAIQDAADAVDVAGDALVLAGDAVSQGVVIGRTVDGLNRTFTSVVSPGRGYVGYENVAPSLYGPTVPVEVRRNVATNPRMLSDVSLPLNNWPAANTLTKSAPLPVPHPQGIVTGAKSVSHGSSAGLLSVYGVDNLTGPGSPERILGVWVLVTEPGYRINHSNGWAAQELTANTWTYVTQATHLSADSWAGLQVSRITGMASTTAACYITGCVAAPGTVPPAQFFDDQYSPEPDMTPELVPGGNGASRLTGLHPTGFTDVNCVSIIHEVGNGTRELRLIPTGASNNTGSWFSIPAGAPRSLATAIGTVRLPAALTGALSPTSRLLAAESPYAGVSAAAPNQPGTSDLVGSISGLTSSYRVHLRHGGALGSGDVYWSNIGLYAGSLPTDAIPFHQGDMWYRLETRDTKLVAAEIITWNGDNWTPHQLWVDSLAAAGSVTAQTIAANAVTAAKIFAGAVTTEKIAALAVTAAELAANAVTAVKIAANAVTAEKINAGAVTTDKLDALAVTAEKIAAGAIIADKIAANAITTAKLAADAIDGMTITGALIRTAASGQRMQLDINGLRAFDSGNVQRALLASSSGGLLLSGTLTSYTGGNTERAVLSNGALTFDYVGSPGAGTMTLGSDGITSTDADSRFKILKTSSAAGVGIDIIAGSGSYETGINIDPALKKISLFAESVEFQGGELSTDVSVNLASILSLASGTSIDGSSWLRKRSDGIVFGTLAFYRAAGFTSGATIATLAAGYQPIGGDQLPAVTWGAAAPSRCHFQIAPTGAIVAWSPGVNRQYISAKVMYRTS